VLKFEETTFGVAQKHILAGVWYLRRQCRGCISAQCQWESFCSSAHGFLVGELEEMLLRSQKAILQSWSEHLHSWGLLNCFCITPPLSWLTSRRAVENLPEQ
jgi:hypothetical protein